MVGSEWKRCSASMLAVYFISNYSFLFVVHVCTDILWDCEQACTYVHRHIHVFCSYPKDSSANSLKGPRAVQRSPEVGEGSQAVNRPVFFTKDIKLDGVKWKASL